MTENELDQALNRWRTPASSPELRARVLANGPRREHRRFGWVKGWAVAAAAVLCVLAVGTAQSGNPAIENLSKQMHVYRQRAHRWIDQLWLYHIVAAFRDSNPKIYVDGELQSDAVFGGKGVGVWVRVPGEGKYYLALSPVVFEGPVPPPSGRFDGHVLEFQTGGRTIRIESNGSYGFGEERPVYVMGPVAGR